MANYYKMLMEAKKKKMDAVDADELKGDHEDREDKDIDNDGDADSSDEYLHKRRKAISKAAGKLKEAMSAKERALKAADEKAQPKSKVSLKKAPWEKTNEEVELDEAMKDHFVFQKGVPKTKEVVHRGSAQSSKEWIEKNAKFYGHKGKDFVIYKGKYPNVKPSDALDFKYVAEEVEELDEKAPKLKPDFVKVQRERDKEHADAMGRHVRSGRKKSVRQMNSTQRSLASMRNEEVEQIDELSKKTLGNYVKKASADMERQGIRQDSQSSSARAMKASNKADRRHKGISKAVDKLTKEDVEQIDEISDALKNRYIRKSMDDHEHSNNVRKDAESRGDKDTAAKMKDRMKKRNKGMTRAFEQIELDEKAYVSLLSPELGRKGSHDVIGKDGKVVKSFPYTKDGMKAAQSHLSKMKEEVEQIDELKKSTLASYVNKASDDRAQNALEIGKSGKINFKGLKRRQGIQRATKRLAKEEAEQIDEISRDTARSYIRKASADNAEMNKKSKKREAGIEMAGKKAYGIGGKAKVNATESVEQLDELSPNTLHSYVKKAAGNLAGNAAVAATQASSSMKKSSPDVKRKMVNRMKGITSASGRLADKANMAEESEQANEGYSSLAQQKAVWATRKDGGKGHPDNKKKKTNEEVENTDASFEDLIKAVSEQIKKGSKY